MTSHRVAADRADVLGESARRTHGLEVERAEGPLGAGTALAVVPAAALAAAAVVAAPHAAALAVALAVAVDSSQLGCDPLGGGSQLGSGRLPHGRCALLVRVGLRDVRAAHR
eukprot:15222548-Heterocapsa_arctica.AAC.1